MKEISSAAWLAAVCAGLMLAAGPAAVMAQVSPPVAVELPIPDPPVGRFGPGPEGWIKVRYSVTPEGRTANVRVVESLPPQLQTRDTVSAVQRWRFDPATDGETPIEWHNNESVIVFDIPETPQEPSPFFVSAYTEAQQLVEEGRYDRAKSRNERLQRDSMFRLYEIGLANMQLAVIEIAQEDYHAAYQAIVRATEPEVPQLLDEELRIALQYRFAIELELGRAVDALQTFERRNAIEAMPAGDPMAQQARALAQAMQGDVTIAVKGIVTSDDWMHVPSRRTFAVGDVSGTLREVGIECDRRTATLPFQEDVEWSVPATWGNCTLAFNGRRGTTFTLFELD
jgi:TonB family protein